MTASRFSGFAIGSPASIVVGSGDFTKSSSVTTFGQATDAGDVVVVGDPSVLLQLTNNGAAAPAVIGVRVLTFDFAKPHDELDIVIDFGDATTTSTGTAPIIEALHGTGTDRSYIDISGKLIEDTDPHTITVTVSDGTTKVVETLGYQMVSNPTPVAQTVFVDPAGSFGVQHSWADAGGIYVVTLNQAVNQVNGALSGQDAIVVLKDDATWEENGFGGRFEGDRSVWIKRSGHGTNKPVINKSGAANGATMIECGLASGNVSPSTAPSCSADLMQSMRLA